MKWFVFVVHNGQLVKQLVQASDALDAMKEVVSVGYHPTSVAAIINVKLDEVCHGEEAIVSEESD